MRRRCKRFLSHHGLDVRSPRDTLLDLAGSLPHRNPAYVDAMREIAHRLRGGPDIAVEPEHPRTNMAHVRLRGDPDRLGAAAMAVSRRTGVWLFSRLMPDPAPGRARFEIAVGDAMPELTPDDIRGLLDDVVALVAGRTAPERG